MSLMFENNIGLKILLLFLYTDLEVRKRSLMQRKGIKFEKEVLQKTENWE